MNPSQASKTYQHAADIAAQRGDGYGASRHEFMADLHREPTEHETFACPMETFARYVVYLALAGLAYSIVRSVCLYFYA